MQPQWISSWPAYTSKYGRFSSRRLLLIDRNGIYWDQLFSFLWSTSISFDLGLLISNLMIANSLLNKKLYNQFLMGVISFTFESHGNFQKCTWGKVLAVFEILEFFTAMCPPRPVLGSAWKECSQQSRNQRWGTERWRVMLQGLDWYIPFSVLCIQ